MCLPGGTVGSNRQPRKPTESPKNEYERAAFAIRGRQAEEEMISRQERGLEERRMLTSGEVGKLEALKVEYEQALGQKPTSQFGQKGYHLYGKQLGETAQSFYTRKAAESQTPVYEGQYQSAEWYEQQIAQLKQPKK